MRNYTRARLRRLLPVVDFEKIRQWMGPYLLCECFRDENLYVRTTDPAEAAFREWIEIVCADYENSDLLHRTTLFVMKNQKWEDVAAAIKIESVKFVEKVVQVIHKLAPDFTNIRQELFKSLGSVP